MMQSGYFKGFYRSRPATPYEQGEFVMVVVQGVALIIVNPERNILTVEEFFDKPLLQKERGMRTVPMETVHLGETDPDVLRRMFMPQEELPGIPIPPLPGTFIDVYEVVPGQRANLYFTNTDSFVLPVPNNDNPEVGNYRWDRPEEVLSSWLRPGARDMVVDYMLLHCCPVIRQQAEQLDRFLFK